MPSTSKSRRNARRAAERERLKETPPGTKALEVPPHIAELAEKLKQQRTSSR